MFAADLFPGRSLRRIKLEVLWDLDMLLDSVVSGWACLTELDTHFHTGKFEHLTVLLRFRAIEILALNPDVFPRHTYRPLGVCSTTLGLESPLSG